MIMVESESVGPDNLPPGMRRPRERGAAAAGAGGAPASAGGGSAVGAGAAGAAGAAETRLAGNDYGSLKEARDAFESEFIRRKLAENKAT